MRIRLKKKVTKKMKSKQKVQQKQVYQQQVLTNNVNQDLDEEGGYVGGREMEKLHELYPEQDKNTEVLSLIITCASGSSYDRLFEEEKQEVPDGIVTVYVADPQYFPTIQKRLEEDKPSDDPVLEKVVKEIKELDPENVLFNWECSSGLEGGLPRQTMQVMKFLLDRGYMCMFSDFAMKGLIKSWDESLLGPRPFKNVGSCNGLINLKFDPQKLKDSPSSQLEMVGNLCETGECSINTLSGTIVIGVNHNNVKDNGFYELEVMTIVTSVKVKDLDSLVKLGDKEGSVGHAILRYKSGGILVASAGHWIELKNLGNVSEQKIQEIVEQYSSAGKTGYMESYTELNNYTGEEREMRKQKLVSQMVQKSAPAKYKKKK